MEIMEVETVFKSLRVTKQNILDALQAYSSEFPDTETYENWLEKETYIYAVRYGDKGFPHKHILSRATGIPPKEFSGFEQTSSVFRQLGFEVVFK